MFAIAVFHTLGLIHYHTLQRTTKNADIEESDYLIVDIFVSFFIHSGVVVLVIRTFLCDADP